MLSRWLTSGTLRVLARLLVLVLLAPVPLWAQAPPAGQGPPVFKPEELDQIAAPIALYPDPLVAQILMASTYPLELVEAARFAKANPSLTGTPLDEAMKQQTWDDSVKALVAFPQVVTMMSDKLDWTQKLGDAFLGQQKDLMDAIQRLRAKAQAQGTLVDSAQQKIVVEPAPAPTVVQAAPAPATIIQIVPTNPQVVYVPTYNPTVVYGAWPYPAYPPYSYYPPGYAMATAALSFTAGVAVGAALWGNCNWGRGDVNVNVNQYNSFTKNVNTANIASQRTQINSTRVASNNGAWQHDPAHRQGVQYRDTATQQRYNKTGAPNPQSREAFRGRAEQGRQDIARGNVQGLDAARGRAGGTGAGQPRAGGAGLGQGGGAGQAGGAANLGQNRGGAQQGGGGSLGQNRQTGAAQNRPEAASFGQNRGASAFQGAGNGREVSAASTRGAQSRQSFGATGGASRAGGSGGGAAARGGGASGGGARGGARGHR